MSQDTGLFSVRRPRETLGGINYNSAIPQPASALKRSNSISNIKESHAPHTSNHARSVSSSRMSLAPNRPQQPNFQRASSGNNFNTLGDAQTNRPSTVQRSSSSNIFAGASANRMSYAPGAMTPANQQSSSASQSLQRRSSIYSRPSSTGPMGHQSFFTQAPAPASARGDPRPWRDPNYRAKVGQDLLDYLTRNNFELEMKRSLNQKSMTSPTQKDFEAMFQWLYHRIDPAYRFMKSIDFEGPAILKQLRYPFENKVSKSQWAAVGGQNWSSFLGMLQWMMQLAQMMDKYEVGEYDDACAEAGVDVNGDRIIFRFLSGAYRDWLQEGDEYGEEEADRMLIPHVEAMAAEFERGNQKYAEEMKILEAENEVLKQQIAEAEAGAPDLAKLEKNFKILEDDKRKFEDYNTNVEAKVEKYEQRNKFLQEEIDRTEAELGEVEQEKTNLQDSVDRQGITIQDIDRMTTERERLQKGLETTTARLSEVKRRAGEKEIDANRSLEELERAVEKYNSLCYQIALIPATAANAKGQDFELHLNISSTPNFSSSQIGASQRGGSNDRLLVDSSTGYHAPHVLNLDVRGYIKSQLLGLRKEINERRTLAIDADMKNHELLDSIKEAIDDKRSEVEALEHRVRAAEEEFEKTKEVTSTQKVASDAQIEKMEKELAKMRAGLDESVQLMEQREMNTNIEFEQLTLRANSLREELHTEIEKILNDVIKFKVHIQQNLENYEAFVDQEVKAELDDGGVEDEELAGVAGIDE
ncbi:kinetochore-associated Ndc80 complex subunit ndc80 [Imshaugia aleurites]|uniref:Kinetochore protein NDC80 n=1 Tax=Imshaugia aleurites TaxID=172621 RepID=A0A8H3J7I9_9LECA|nr:kinetochore-associated Ndc80 complex subunit ndc80 [Imshaugia aleurites]